MTLRLLQVLIVGALCVMTACGSKPPKPVTPVVSISMHVEPDVNPDPDGRAKPIVLHIYQLKSDAAFANSNYFALVDDEKKTLAGDLVSREEKELAPGDTRTLEAPLGADTRFIAVLGEYRDLDHSGWQSITPVAPPKKKGRAVYVAVHAERTQVTVSVDTTKKH
jgi:type VI secretion system protein VasD